MFQLTALSPPGAGGSQAPAEDPATARIPHMPLCSPRLAAWTERPTVSLPSEGTHLGTRRDWVMASPARVRGESLSTSLAQNRSAYFHKPIQLPASQLPKYLCQQQDSKLQVNKAMGRNKWIKQSVRNCPVQATHVLTNSAFTGLKPHSLGWPSLRDSPATPSRLCDANCARVRNLFRKA